MKYTVLITGAGGFVGSVLLRSIINDYPQAKPYIFLRKSSNIWRINDVLKKVGVYEVDLEDELAVKRAVGRIKPEVVFHLAAYGAYPAQNSLEQAIRTNVLGTKNLLTAMEGVDYKLFVNTGSSSEYGYKNHPMKETDYLEPASYYAATKAAATQICTTYGNLNNRPIVTLRLFSVYGPYEESGRFVPTAVLRAIKNETIDVVQGPRRDFVYVGDVVDAYLDCLRLKNYKERIFNISSGIQTSIEDTARLIVKLSGSRAKIAVGAYKPRPWDTSFWVGRNTLAKRVLGWRPEHTLREGLTETIDWFRNNEKLYDS